MKKHSPRNAPAAKAPSVRAAGVAGGVLHRASPLSPVAALLCVLCLGCVCVYLVSGYLTTAGTPPLFLNFVHKPDGTLPLHFFNSGKEAITLDLAGMQRFLFHPAGGGNKYILHIRNKPFGPDEAENRRRLAVMKTLAPREAFEIGDLRPVIAALPDNTTLALVAAYAGKEEVRSLPLILREEN